MSLARGMSNYAMAGGQHQSGDRFNVSAHVYVPGGDAGTACESCFQAHQGRKARGRRISFSRNFAFVYLGVVIFGALMYLGLLNYQCSQLTRQVTQVAQSMKNDLLTIESLEETVKANIDPANICVKALEFGMVASADENTHHIFLPEIEQFTKAEQNEQMTAAAELPLLGAQAHLSGSR